MVKQYKSPLQLVGKDYDAKDPVNAYPLYNYSEKDFMVEVIRMLTELKRTTEWAANKIKEYEREMRKIQIKMTELKNFGRHNKKNYWKVLPATEEQISEFKDKVQKTFKKR